MEKQDNTVTIALDAMGGDHAPDEVIRGAGIIAENSDYENLRFKIYGDAAKINPLLASLPKLVEKSELIHTSQVVGPEEKPSSAIRNFKDSSMQVAINSLKENKADAVVSAGNTGALMAMSIITLRTLPQIHRPAIVTLIPTMTGKLVMLDLGANIECDATNLYQFAIMGEVFARIVLGKKEPSIGLLNIGSEEMKGKDSIKLAYTMLKNTTLPINFHGYVEGNNIADGSVDVIVADGFTGNVVLKSIQGYAKVYKHLAKQAFMNSSWFAKLQFLFAKAAFKKIAASLDPRHYNGAMLIGLNGIVVKSHGSMDKIGIANAIKVAYSLASSKINDQIAEEVSATVNLETA